MVVTGTSRMMVTSSFESIACSLLFSRFSFCLPLSWSVDSRIFSMEPNCLMSFLAVFSPIPGTPGMLSAASPQRPRMSMTCDTRSMSHCSRMVGTSRSSTSEPFLPGFHMVVVGLTSWAKSLSGVTMKVWNEPSSSACLAMVPMMSSASKPGISMTGMLKAFRMRLTCGMAKARSSGMASRWAL